MNVTPAPLVFSQAPWLALLCSYSVCQPQWAVDFAMTWPGDLTVSVSIQGLDPLTQFTLPFEPPVALVVRELNESGISCGTISKRLTCSCYYMKQKCCKEEVRRGFCCLLYFSSCLDLWTTKNYKAKISSSFCGGKKASCCIRRTWVMRRMQCLFSVWKKQGITCF